VKSLKSQFSDFFELPEEVILDLPLIMLVGPEKLFLENHKGITLYRKDLIKIRINPGFLIIKGNELEINEIAANKLYISGSISGLNYCNTRVGGNNNG